VSAVDEQEENDNSVTWYVLGACQLRITSKVSIDAELWAW